MLLNATDLANTLTNTFAYPTIKVAVDSTINMVVQSLPPERFTVTSCSTVAFLDLDKLECIQEVMLLAMDLVGFAGCLQRVI